MTKNVTIILRFKKIRIFPLLPVYVRSVQFIRIYISISMKCYGYADISACFLAIALPLHFVAEVISSQVNKTVNLFVVYILNIPLIQHTN